MTLGKTLVLTQQRFPQVAALTCGDRSLTYLEFNEQADRIAAGLLAGGLKPGERVALHMRNSIELALSFYGCFKAGAVAVPVNTALKPQEIEYVLDHSESSVYLGEACLFPEAQSIVNQRQALRQVYVVGDPARPFSALLEPISGTRLPEPEETDFAAIVYSSGTTARPKGVMHTHQSLCSMVETVREVVINVFGSEFIGENPGILIMTPMMHMSGLYLLLPGVAMGQRLVLLGMFDPEVALDLLERHQCASTLGMPAMYQFLVRAQERKPRDLGAARLYIAGGDAVPPALHERFATTFGKPLIEGHGMTEVVPTCGNRPGRMRLGSMGEPSPGVEIRVVDESHQDLAPGQIGEMLVRAPHQTTGYWMDSEATRAAIRDGWLHTGDLARKDEDGYLWFEGRMKEIIKRGGNKISPQEVEAVLLQHPAVFEAGVTGVKDEIYGETIAAFIVPRPGESLIEADLAAFAKARLAAYKVPERFVFQETLPKGVTGKVHRRLLREMASQWSNAASAARG